VNGIHSKTWIFIKSSGDADGVYKNQSSQWGLDLSGSQNI